MADPPAAPRAGAMGPPAVGGAGEAFARGAAATAAAAAAAAAAAGKGGSSGRAGEDEAEEESRRRKKRQREDQGGGGGGGGAFAAAQETQRRKDDGCSEEDGDEGSLRKRCRSVACGAKPYVEARARAGPERAEHNGWMGRAPPLHQGITTQRGGGPAEAAAAVPAAAQPAESKSSAPDNPELRRPARVKGPPGGGGGDGGRPRGRLGASSFTQPPGGAAPAPAGRRLPARMHCVRDAHTPSGRGCHNALSRAVTRVCQKAGFTGGTAFAIDELAKVTELCTYSISHLKRKSIHRLVPITPASILQRQDRQKRSPIRILK
ncbi:MAG: hypothetical protein BJ554DRAFT_1028 [Olpidium bornovanus]|uniref:Uncharacterized protein n=1 Tax=Olpidium bornovanus TaxID=278681 RepID=A0A8H7ZT18_9FUNG|nr:MAG: hypothetical protein BJ554DRAFT_1028 [Olpidium bornovanus]